MTIKHLTGAYPRGYALSAAYDGLVIESSASVGGRGVRAGFEATITNLGQVYGSLEGVTLNQGGAVVNGSTSDTAARIAGASSGVFIRHAPGAVTNFATISGAGAFGVLLEDGGSVTNGSNPDTLATIEGGEVGIIGGLSASTTLTNHGTILGETRYGVELGAGVVTNGSNADTRARIQGAAAGILGGSTIANYGTILALAKYGDGVVPDAGGLVTNGSNADTEARIQSSRVGIFGVGPIVINYGTIQGGSLGRSWYAGVSSDLTSGLGVSVTNGSAADTAALIEGYTGVYSFGRAHVSNFGTIRTDQDHGVGLILNGGGVVRNGSAADAGALISGETGVLGFGGGLTIANFGTIAGTGGTAVSLASAGDKLRIEPGAVFRGAVLGGGAVLALASGRGTLDALAGGDVTVSGRSGTTTFTDFGTLKLAEGARFTLTGTGVIAGGGTAALIDNGRLTVTSSLVVSGTLSGRGTLVLAGGARVEIDSRAPANLSTAFARGAAATLALGAPAQFSATIAGFAAGDTIDLVGTAATGAAVNGSDQLVITNGATTIATLQLRGDYAGASFDLAADGHGGTAITLTPGPAARAARLVSAMASLTAGPGAPHAPIWRPPDAVRPLFASPLTAFA